MVRSTCFHFSALGTASALCSTSWGISDNVQIRRFDRETTMLGVDSAASMLRCSLTARQSDKSISLRVAQFAQFKAGRLISMRVLVDTFDLVEQALGRQIHLPKMTN